MRVMKARTLRSRQRCTRVKERVDNEDKPLATAAMGSSATSDKLSAAAHKRQKKSVGSSETADFVAETADGGSELSTEVRTVASINTTNRTPTVREMPKNVSAESKRRDKVPALLFDQHNEKHFGWPVQWDGDHWVFDGYGTMLLRDLPAIVNYESDDVRLHTNRVLKYVMGRPDKCCLKGSFDEKYSQRGHRKCLCFVHMKKALQIYCPDAYDEVTNKFFPSKVPEAVYCYFEVPMRLLIATVNLNKSELDWDKYFRYLLRSTIVIQNDASMGSSYYFQFPFFRTDISRYLSGLRWCVGMIGEICGIRRPKSRKRLDGRPKTKKDRANDRMNKPSCHLSGTRVFRDLCNAVSYAKTDINSLSLIGRKKLISPPGQTKKFLRKIALRYWHAQTSARYLVLQCMTVARIREGKTEMSDNVSKETVVNVFKELFGNFLTESCVKARFKELIGAVQTPAGENARVFIIADHNVFYSIDEGQLCKRPDLKPLVRWVKSNKDESIPTPMSSPTESKTKVKREKMKEIASVFEHHLDASLQIIAHELRNTPGVAHTLKKGGSMVPSMAVYRSYTITVPVRTEKQRTGSWRQAIQQVVLPCKGEVFWHCSKMKLCHDFDCCVLPLPTNFPLDSICDGMLQKSVGPKCLLTRGILRLNGNDNVFFKRKGWTLCEFLHEYAANSDTSGIEAALTASIKKWANNQVGLDTDTICIRVYEGYIVPDFTKCTVETARLELPYQLVEKERAKGNKIVVGVIPVAPQGHLRRVFTGPFVLPKTTEQGLNPWVASKGRHFTPEGMDDRGQPWEGYFLHMQPGSFIVGPATMLMSDGLHVNNGITPYITFIAVIGNKATMPQSVDMDRLSLDCYFNAYGPLEPTLEEQNRVKELECLEQNTTFMRNKDMSIPSVISLTPTKPNPIQDSIRHQVSGYLMKHLGPVLVWGSLENLGNADYQIKAGTKRQSAITKACDVDVPRQTYLEHVEHRRKHRKIHKVINSADEDPDDEDEDSRMREEMESDEEPLLSQGMALTEGGGSESDSSTVEE